MSRRFQFSLKWLFALTLTASLAAALAHYNRRAKIADAEEFVASRRKAIERLSALCLEGCREMRLLDNKKAELQKAEKRLRELKGD